MLLLRSWNIRCENLSHGSHAERFVSRGGTVPQFNEKFSNFQKKALLLRKCNIYLLLMPPFICFKIFHPEAVFYTFIGLGVLLLWATNLFICCLF